MAQESESSVSVGEQASEQSSGVKEKALNSLAPLLVLLLLFVIIVLASRVYIGGPDGLMIVWKGVLSADDTVVNLHDYAGVPREQLEKKPQLLMQMEEMHLLDPVFVKVRRKSRIKKDSGSELRSESATDGSNLAPP